MTRAGSEGSDRTALSAVDLILARGLAKKGRGDDEAGADGEHETSGGEKGDGLGGGLLEARGGGGDGGRVGGCSGEVSRERADGASRLSRHGSEGLTAGKEERRSSEAGTGTGVAGLGGEERQAVKTIIQRVLLVLKEEVERDDKKMKRSVRSTVSGIEAEICARDVVLYIQMELCHNRTLAHWLADHNAPAAGEKRRGGGGERAGGDGDSQAPSLPPVAASGDSNGARARAFHRRPEEHGSGQGVGGQDGGGAEGGVIDGGQGRVGAGAQVRDVDAGTEAAAGEDEQVTLPPKPQSLNALNLHPIPRT